MNKRYYTIINLDRLFVPNPQWFVGEVEDYWLKLGLVGPPATQEKRIAELLKIHSDEIGFIGEWRRM
jgi:hypothetical protein